MRRVNQLFNLPNHLRRFLRLRLRSLPKHLLAPGRQRKREKVRPIPSVDVTINTNLAVEGQQQSDFRTWHDSSGSHWHEAALVDCKDGTVHLSSSDGRLLEINESKLSSGDLNYLQSSDVYRKAHRKVNSSFFCFPVHSLISPGIGIPWYGSSRSARCYSSCDRTCRFRWPRAIRHRAVVTKTDTRQIIGM